MEQKGGLFIFFFKSICQKISPQCYWRGGAQFLLVLAFHVSFFFLPQLTFLSQKLHFQEKIPLQISAVSKPSKNLKGKTWQNKFSQQEIWTEAKFSN